jgi:hypothetical protein
LEILIFGCICQTTSPEVEFMHIVSRRRVDSRSLRSTLRYESTLMEFIDNLSKPPDFFFIQTVTTVEWTCLYKIINWAP